MEERPFNLTRKQIAAFMPDPRQIKAWESLQFFVNDNADFVLGVKASQIVTLVESPVLPEQRILTGSANVTVTDGGALGPVTLDLSNTGVVAGPYGSEAETISVTVDAKGRLTGIEAFPLNSDNVTEGTTNLYFTNARARAALSGGTGINYNAGTGVIAIDNTIVTTAGAQTLTDKTLNGYKMSQRTVTATTTALSTDCTIFADATAGAIIVNLPAAAGASGQVYTVKKIDASANTVTIDPNGAELIDGAATKAIATQYNAFTFQSTGSQWFIL